MADVLQTVLQLIGGQQYVAQLNKAASAHTQLARAQQQQAAAQRQVAAAQAAGRVPSPRAAALAGGAEVTPAFGNFAGTVALAAVSAITIEVKSATAAFEDYQRALIQTQMFQRNMGNSVPTIAIENLAREVSDATNVSQTELVQLQGYLARFGTDAATVQRAMIGITNAARGTNMSIMEMAEEFEKTRKGHAKELFTQLGIPIRGVEGQLYDLNQILDITDKKTKDMAAAFHGTLPGALDESKKRISDLQLELGRLFAPMVGPIVRQFNRARKSDVDTLRMFEHAIGINPANEGTHTATTLGGVVGRHRSEEYLRRIEMNTGPQGALGRAVRGGGSYSEPGGGMPIRDLQSMFRHHH